MTTLSLGVGPLGVVAMSQVGMVRAQDLRPIWRARVGLDGWQYAEDVDV